MNNLLKQFSIKNGLLLGGISAALTIIFYVINPLIQYTNLYVPLLSAVLIIALLVILGLDVRKKIGGFWTFGQAYLSLIIMSFFVVLVSILISFIVFKFVDPALPTKVNDAIAEVTAQRLEGFGMDQTQIDAASKQFTNGEFIATIQPTFFNEAKGFVLAMIFYGVIDLIIAACIKRKPPMFVAGLSEETDEVV